MCVCVYECVYVYIYIYIYIHTRLNVGGADFNQGNEKTQSCIHYGTKNINSKKKKKKSDDKLADRFRSSFNNAKIEENII